MKIGIGIDTGGTYTDAVLYDFHSRTVVAKAKALTTRENLAVGIEAAMSSLPQGQLVKAEIVGLSTTLATNACVENKGGRARLMFWGGPQGGGIHWGALWPAGYGDDRISGTGCTF
ncbi:MAG: hydantoinase/oxoprolinase N-terminal domain-containing protein [Clostridia bacterium]